MLHSPFGRRVPSGAVRLIDDENEEPRDRVGDTVAPAHVEERHSPCAHDSHRACGAPDRCVKVQRPIRGRKFILRSFNQTDVPPYPGSLPSSNYRKSGLRQASKVMVDSSLLHHLQRNTHACPSARRSHCSDEHRVADIHRWSRAPSESSMIAERSLSFRGVAGNASVGWTLSRTTDAGGAPKVSAPRKRAPWVHSARCLLFISATLCSRL